MIMYRSPSFHKSSFVESVAYTIKKKKISIPPRKQVGEMNETFALALFRH